MNEDTNIKAIDFASLEVGDKFFTNRLAAAENDDKTCLIKVESKKNLNGTWTNAKNRFGSESFIKYDSRVWLHV